MSDTPAATVTTLHRCVVPHRHEVVEAAAAADTLISCGGVANDVCENRLCSQGCEALYL